MTDLGDRIRQRIRDGGPMRFRDWMEMCLYDPDGGYYMQPGRKTGAGDDADFATSPTLHPFMGEAVGKEAVQVWAALGQPPDFQVVEFGGGEGDLARSALAWLDDHAADLATTIAWTHLEISPVHRDAQTTDDGRIHHATELPTGATGLVLAHEFIDALPFAILEWRKGNWAEVHVGLDGDRFVESFGIPSRSSIEAAPKRLWPDGTRVVSMPDAQVWMNDMAAALERGRILIIDYGDLGKHLWGPDRPDASVRGFQGHQLVEPLQCEPGSCDITANVDFTQLQQWATFEGLTVQDLQSQEAFLVDHGVLERLAHAPKDSVEDASAYLRLKQTVLPQGMGHAFKVQRFDRGIRNSDG